MSRLRTGRRPAPRRPRAPAAPAIALADDWRAWIVDNALDGVPRAALIEALTEGGVPPHLAVAEVDAALASPALARCRALQRRAERLELVARLLRTMASLAPQPDAVERRTTVPADEFFAHYFAASRPVVLTGVAAAWPAVARWTPAYFKERLGDVEIETLSGRDADPECDRRVDAHREVLRMADYVDRVLAAGTSNDVYLVANNKNMERPALRALLDDVRPPEDLFDPARLAGAVSLWLGPAGTVTPLHHDTTNILFCQIHGRKRVDLVSPLETALLDRASGFYAEARPEDLEGVRVLRVELAPGEALFIPAGWWHEVRALDVSISFSLLNFRRPTDFGWYRPGA